ncbi:MAG TPA: hypothetical protein VFT23_11075 [Burkholderiales bacterium]|nr:hypothetical protein [Burkholderiales bacterium]
MAPAATFIVLSSGRKTSGPGVKHVASLDHDAHLIALGEGYSYARALECPQAAAHDGVEHRLRAGDDVEDLGCRGLRFSKRQFRSCFSDALALLRPYFAAALLSNTPHIFTRKSFYKSAASSNDRGCVETINLARQTTNLLCSNFSASRKASVEAATPSSWRWKNQALAFSHSLDPKRTMLAGACAA